jgi:CheY-like chemotaxis protein
MNPDSDVGQQLRALREDYSRQLSGKLAQIDEVAHAGLGDEGMASLRFLAHGLAGSGTTFGFPDVSRLARQLELTVAIALEEHRQLSGAERATIGPLVEQLRRAAQSPAERMPPLPLPRAPVRSADGKPLHLVEDDAPLAAELALQLGNFGYRVTVFDSPRRLLETAAADAAPALILMDIGFPEGELAGAQAIRELSEARRLNAPVVFMSVRNDLAARLAAIRAGARAYVVKPVDITALAAPLDELTANRPDEPFRVLIVDDSELLARYHACVLQAAGMLTEVVTDPMRVLAHLADFRPDLVLMDIQLPDIDGITALGQIRADPQTEKMCVVAVSASVMPDDQQRIVASGFDAYITKPITPETFVREVEGYLSGGTWRRS